MVTGVALLIQRLVAHRMAALRLTPLLLAVTGLATRLMRRRKRLRKRIARALPSG